MQSWFYYTGRANNVKHVINNVINKKIDYYREKFDNSNFTADKKKLEISFEEYEYKEYRSFKFIIKSNVGISHDIEEVFTVNFKGDTVIDINYFKQKNKANFQLLIFS